MAFIGKSSHHLIERVPVSSGVEMVQVDEETEDCIAWSSADGLRWTCCPRLLQGGLLRGLQAVHLRRPDLH